MWCDVSSTLRRDLQSVSGECQPPHNCCGDKSQFRYKDLTAGGRFHAFERKIVVGDLSCKDRLQLPQSHPGDLRLEVYIHHQAGTYHRHTTVNTGILICSELKFVQYSTMVDKPQPVDELVSFACWAHKPDWILESQANKPNVLHTVQKTHPLGVHITY